MLFCVDDKRIKCTPPKVEKGKTPLGRLSVRLEFTLLQPTNKVADIFGGVFYFYDEGTGRVLTYTGYPKTNLLHISHNADATCTVVMIRSERDEGEI